MKTINEITQEMYNHKIKKNKNYTHEQAKIDVKKYLHEKKNTKNTKKVNIENGVNRVNIVNREDKINIFNKDFESIDIDRNGIPKIIHFTCKDKNNLNNKTWEECLSKYKEMYSDYKIIIYDNNDIYKIIETLNKKNLESIKSIKIGAVLADIFRYYILYLRGGYYSDLDCEPIKHIEKLSETQYHGNNKNNLFIYSENHSLINKQCDFYDNPCNNCVFQTNKSNVNIYKCLGHKYINDQTNIILCYEYEKTWHRDLINNEEIKSGWTDNNVGICQWFIGSKPKEKLFLYCYKECIKKINYLQSLNKNNDNNYHYNVINACGPLFFTKIINKLQEKHESMRNKITILPSDYFCCGSYEKVPSTKNTFIKHHFTGTWLK